jgi:hypothetical protein
MQRCRSLPNPKSPIEIGNRKSQPLALLAERQRLP